MSFQSAISGAFQQLHKIAGVEITYTHGTDWIKLNAIPGKSDFLVDVNDGNIVSHRSRDYMVNAADFIMNNAPLFPVRGDTIKEMVNGATHIYRVERPDLSNEQAWRYSDVGRTEIRIHTVLDKVI